MALRCALCYSLLITLLAISSQASESAPPRYPLIAHLEPGAASDVEVDLEVGGELLVRDAQGQIVRLPLNATAELAFEDLLVSWSPEATSPCRSVRQYRTAEAELKSDPLATGRQLPAGKNLVVAESGPGRMARNGLFELLTTEEAEAIDALGDPLTLDRLLPNRELGVDESWEHTSESIGSLLGMGRVTLCNVSSRVTLESRNQVQLELSGHVAGTIDGAATTIEVKGAYVFHLAHKRITKFNLAVKEQREPGHASPGLDATAKLTVRVIPRTSSSAVFDEEAISRAQTITEAELRQLLIDGSDRGYRFRHDGMWLITSRQRELLSLRLVQEGRLAAHCNVAVSPAREGRKAPTLEKFEGDIRNALGGRLERIAAAKQWKSPAGHQVLGIFADGKVEEAAVQWRYYLIEQEGLPRVSVMVTIEHERMLEFADADRLIVDSLELLDPSRPATADRSGADATGLR